MNEKKLTPHLDFVTRAIRERKNNSRKNSLGNIISWNPFGKEKNQTLSKREVF